MAFIHIYVSSNMFFELFLGIPDSMVVSHMPLGPTVFFSLDNVVLRHDLPQKPPPMSVTDPHLIFDNFSTKLGMEKN